MRSKFLLMLIFVMGLITSGVIAADIPPTNSIPSPQAPKTVYQWRTAILAQMFYIGDGKKSDRWNKGWSMPSSAQKDDPDNRNGYSSGDHASLTNPFYVALPFNDLAYPDKARQYLPPTWQQSAKDGKSVCQHRWIEIKNAQGRVCYAQWEDVGPLRNDHAEYVFGDERPGSGNSPGLAISGSIKRYLGLNGRANLVSWRFVDDDDIPPGAWLKFDESDGFFVPKGSK